MQMSYHSLRGSISNHRTSSLPAPIIYDGRPAQDQDLVFKSTVHVTFFGTPIDMRNNRNPRYAPESLERKLSPSSVGGGLLTVAAVSTMTDTTPTPPPPGQGPAPEPAPLPPTGPVGPA